METKKRIKKALLAIIMAGAMVGVGYGMARAVKIADHPGRPRYKNIGHSHGSGELQ